MVSARAVDGYTYDANGSGWGQQYGFDSFGNLLSKTVTSGSGPSMSVSVNPATNQIEAVDGYTYDADLIPCTRPKERRADLRC